MLDLKEKVGDNLYGFNLPDGQILPFRLLTYREFSGCRTTLVTGTTPPNDVYSYVYRTCVLSEVYASHPDKLHAGIPNLIAQIILEMSGMCDVSFIKDLLEIERQGANTLESQMRIKICQTFPGYKMSDLDYITFPELIKLFAEAEAGLLQANIIEKPFEIVKDNNKPKGFSVEEAEKEAIQYGRI